MARPQKGGALDKAFPCLCGSSLAGSISASRYLTSHFLTNVTKPQLALSLSHLEDACGHLVFKNFAFQASHFPCLCIKRNRWWKPQLGGGKPTKWSLPRGQHSRWYHLIRAGPQIAFKRDQCFASGQTQPGHTAIHSVTSEGTRSWTSSPFGHSPPQPIAWVAFMPIACSLLRGKCWLFCTLQSIQFCGHKTFSSCLTQYTKTSLLSQNHWTLASEEHQGLAKGM